MEPIVDLSYDCREFSVCIEDYPDIIEGIDELVDHVQCNTHFEVDEEALRSELRHIIVQEVIELRDDCIIKRIR
ncbi:hypothetical protein [Bacillus phage PK16]|nr:hypothetical protein [Bacillus phage PK16]AUM58812.1 hypothetical protein BCP01_010 [Bacillus phage BCP01]